jgi:NAD(P)H-hydrate epimerase
MPGAAILCGEAALRAGAGKVSVATDTSHAGLIAIARPELMARAVSGPDDLDSLLGKADVVAIGPGLGTTAWARGLLSQALRRGLATVLDADALNIVAEDAGGLTKSEAPRIITPHPGEAARLLGRPAADVQADRPGAARALAKQFGAIAVLKGANTLVAAPGSTPTVCTSGNPGMATAGMGDVLTGIIAAFLAQGMTPRDAAVFGVEAHARAGDRAARDGQRGMLAGDLLGALRGVINPAGCA